MSDRRFINENAPFNRDSKPKHDPEVQALDAVRAAIRDRDMSTLETLAGGEMPQGWPGKFAPYLGKMATSASSFLQGGDRNTTWAGFSGFTVPPKKPIVDADQTTVLSANQILAAAALGESQHRADDTVRLPAPVGTVAAGHGGQTLEFTVYPHFVDEAPTQIIPIPAGGFGNDPTVRLHPH
ncbi:MAG TPA: hypothetical protein VF466_05630 [Candidatus Saccharimonadales bacterium]